MIPEDIREEYVSAFIPKDEDAELWKYVKAADKISALIKCMQERQAGNSDFVTAEKSTRESIKALGLPEADMFMDEFLPPYKLTLDELKQQ